MSCASSSLNTNRSIINVRPQLALHDEHCTIYSKVRAKYKHTREDTAYKLLLSLNSIPVRTHDVYVIFAASHSLSYWSYPSRLTNSRRTRSPTCRPSLQRCPHTACNGCTTMLAASIDHKHISSASYRQLRSLQRQLPCWFKIGCSLASKHIESSQLHVLSSCQRMCPSPGQHCLEI